jgi:hypothetical protein
MGSPILEVASFQRLGALKEDQLGAVFHKEARGQRIMSHRVFIEAPGLDIDVDFRACHAENLGVKLFRPVQIINWKTKMMNAF